MKGLKTLSQIAKQQPEYLDVCATATISRLLGRQIKSLRSQVARTACITAGDIFSSQIRGIDQVNFHYIIHILSCNVIVDNIHFLHSLMFSLL